MAKVYSETQPSAIIAASSRQLWRTASVGVIVGVVVWGLALLLETYVYSTILCRGDLAQKCSAAPQYAAATAALVAAGVGLFALARLQVFRPLLVVLASLISLWSLLPLLADMPWYGALIAAAAVYGLSYALFSWVVRLRSFIMAVLIVVILIVAVRLMLNA